MQMEAHISAGTIDRLEEQSALLQRIYQAEFAKDPTSPATESSRSNMIALRHSINHFRRQCVLPFAYSIVCISGRYGSLDAKRNRSNCLASCDLVTKSFMIPKH